MNVDIKFEAVIFNTVKIVCVLALKGRLIISHIEVRQAFQPVIRRQLGKAVLRETSHAKAWYLKPCKGGLLSHMLR